jgi:NAD(P)H dehydrogenase (quinone)
MATTFLVTGGSGQLGRRVLELLFEAKAGTLITTTRRPEKLADLASRGVTVRKADFDDPGSLRDAFAGADRMLLISTDAVARPGQRIAQHRAAVEAAQEAGVNHVAYTSLTHPGPESPVTFAPDHYGTEQALASSRMGWTILRNNVYTDFLLRALPQAVATGKLVAAAANGGAAYVTREDCARAAAAALTSRDVNGKILDITGPAVVTHAQLAQIAGALTGRTVVYTPVEPNEQRKALITAGIPEVYADIMVSFDVARAKGTLAVVSNAVQELTGQSPTGVAAVLESNRAALVPAAQGSGA